MPKLLFQKLEKIFRLKIAKTSFFKKLPYLKPYINSTKLNSTTYCTLMKAKRLKNHQNYMEVMFVLWKRRHKGGGYIKRRNIIKNIEDLVYKYTNNII